jgi:membrane associated rhomboid family serine protease
MLGTLPPATRAILFATIGVFVLQQLAEPRMRELFALWPLGPLFQPWQVVTYAFMHGGFAHIFFNMFALFMFGRELEEHWGSRRFTVFYFASVLAAAAAQLITTFLSGAFYPTVGASGGVFGLLLAFAMHFPHQRITLLFPPIPMPAWLFVTLYGILELFLGVTGTQQGVAHFAHLGGMLGGYIVIVYWRTQRRGRRPF